MVAILDAVVIGAGAAGLTASYELARNGLNIKLLEASGRIGGRVRKTDTFTVFPLDLGGAWIHLDPSVLDDIVNDANVPVDKSKIVDYKPDYRYYWGPDKSWNPEVFSEKQDHSFINSTWFDFFQHYIAPASAASLELNCVVNQIDSTSNSFIKVTCKDGRAFQAKNVVVTTSIAVLKRADITFLPDLPSDKKQAIQNVKFDDGLKVFFKFSKRFYDQAFDAYYSEADDTADGDRYFFDATYGQSTYENILGVFIRGVQAGSYVNLGDDAIKSKLLSEIDLMYAGQASRFYLSHNIANWNKEPYIGGLYSNHAASNSYGAIKTISSPISIGRIYFAGEALEPNGEYGYVHGAALTGQSVAKKILAITPRPSPPTAVPTAIPTSSPVVAPNKTNFCFSGESSVEVKKKGFVLMKDLVLGDEVLVAEGTYDKVYSFGHRHESIETNFLQFLPSSVEISLDHMIKIGGRYVPARHVRVGDQLETASGEFVTVNEINMISRKGVYAPFTLSGTILVNGVKASSYVSLQGSESLLIGGFVTPFGHQWIAHLAQAPRRLWVRINGVDTNEKYTTTTGVSTWIQVPLEFSEWYLHQNALLMILLLIPAIAGLMLLSSVDAFLALVL